MCRPDAISSSGSSDQVAVGRAGAPARRCARWSRTSRRMFTNSTPAIAVDDPEQLALVERAPQRPAVGRSVRRAADQRVEVDVEGVRRRRAARARGRRAARHATSTDDAHAPQPHRQQLDARARAAGARRARAASSRHQLAVRDELVGVEQAVGAARRAGARGRGPGGRRRLVGADADRAGHLRRCRQRQPLEVLAGHRARARAHLERAPAHARSSSDSGSTPPVAATGLVALCDARHRPRQDAQRARRDVAGADRRRGGSRLMRSTAPPGGTAP